jgi:endonuclease G
VAGQESYLLEHAADNRRRLVVFTGPIFSDLDPVYRGVDIPLRFFKVAVFIHEGELAATGYVVDQTPQLAELPYVPRPGAIDEARRWVRSGRSRPPSGTSPNSPA